MLYNHYYYHRAINYHNITCSSQFLAMPYYVIQRFFLHRIVFIFATYTRITTILYYHTRVYYKYTWCVYSITCVYRLTFSVFFSSSLYFLFIQLCLKKREIFLFFFFLFFCIKFVNQHMAMNSFTKYFRNEIIVFIYRNTERYLYFQ